MDPLALPKPICELFLQHVRRARGQTRAKRPKTEQAPKKTQGNGYIHQAEWPSLPFGVDVLFIESSFGVCLSSQTNTRMNFNMRAVETLLLQAEKQRAGVCGGRLGRPACEG